MQNVRDSRLGRKNKRGVSPIIATILLVAITVVLAAVLYILVTGIIGGSSSKPLQLGFGSSGSTHNGADTINYDNFTMSASSGLTTGGFGLKITTPSGTPVASGAVVGCTVGSSVTTCAVPASGWYAVITNSANNVVAAYGSSGSWTGTPTAVSASQTLTLVSPVATVLAGSGDTLAAFGTGSSQVSGQTTL